MFQYRLILLLLILTGLIHSQNIDDLRRAKQLTSDSVLNPISRASLNISSQAKLLNFGKK